MALFESAERTLAERISRVGYSNPFLPERRDLEREALGEDYADIGGVWSMEPDWTGAHPNVQKLTQRAAKLAEEALARIEGGAKPGAGELDLYEDVVLFFIYNRYQAAFYEMIVPALERGTPAGRAIFWKEFHGDLVRFLSPGRGKPPEESEAAHLFASFFQVRRAFHLIFGHVIGRSAPAARLRGAAWQSVFTHDMRRYRRTLYQRMGDVPCLITGPTGTGKEVVARAIGMSRFIPFDPKTGSFTEDFVGSFHALNLSALTPTLIESELFGHKRGSFTGAIADRAGWLEVCRPMGAVFLDEIGEVDPAIQVKLLRVLQTRQFQRLGESEPRKFQGKIIAATNRDLALEMQAGRFRPDFYYRLCADMIQTPTLAEQLRDAPDDLRHLVIFMVRRVAGEDPELAEEVARWIETKLGLDYPWPGNVRELEQCVRNIMIRRAYDPPAAPPAEPRAAIARETLAGKLTAEELLSRYTTLVYSETENYQETARRLGLDHRTVKARIDEKLLAELRRK